MRGNIIPFPGAEFPNALVLKVELVLAPRPIWRLIQMGGLATFWDLHVAIQDSMGWLDRHLHLFTADHPVTGERLRFGVPDPSDFYGSRDVLAGWQAQLRDILRPDFPPILYTYDLGAEWQHEIAVEAMVPAMEAGRNPRCLAGEGACPPEACGGVAGYRRLLAALAGPDAGQQSRAQRVLGAEFDPGAFDPERIVFTDPADRWREMFESE